MSDIDLGVKNPHGTKDFDGTTICWKIWGTRRMIPSEATDIYAFSFADCSCGGQDSSCFSMFCFTAWLIGVAWVRTRLDYMDVWT